MERELSRISRLVLSSIYNDGGLAMDKNEIKDFNKLSCPNCTKRTISWIDSLKQVQTCENCNKQYIGVVPTLANYIINGIVILSYILSIYLYSSSKVSPLISGAIMISGLVLLVIYRLWPKGLEEVEIESTNEKIH